MDRITKAIEQAKRDREGSPNHVSANDTRRSANILDNIGSYEIEPSVWAENKIIASFWNGIEADAYRLLRTRILQRMRQNNWNTIGVTSVHPLAGKTLTSINLAMTIAIDQNHSSILIDADLRRPSVHRYLGFEPEYGIGEFIQSDELPLDKIAVGVGQEGLTVIPGKSQMHGSSELLTAPKLLGMVKQLKKINSNQILMFDLPPVFVGDDVVALSEQLDCVLLVVEDGVTSRKDLLSAHETLANSNVIGSVLNKSNESQAANYGSYY